jgi:predicted lipid carrier protein YhbT
MVRFLSQEWLDELRRLATDQPERPGADARVQYVVTGGPDGDVRYWWRIEHGQLVDAQLGMIDDPDVTLTMSHGDAVAVQRGELDANAAFMQGRMKAEGNMGRLLQLMPLTTSPEYREWQERVRAVTEF